MICPKCGRPVEEAAVICTGCDFILDTGFLGGDILDEEQQLRPGQGGVDPAVFNLADAVILGNIGDDTSSFETSDSGFHLRKEAQAARLYVSGRSQAVMSPDAVVGLIDAAGNKGVRLTPFEKHVLRFIDGRRPVEAIRRQAGLDEAEVKTALATLADKGVVKVVGRALADAGADFDVDTAPGIGNKKHPRRVRGTLVGAVVVVGDSADQAIDDAFRTQVRAAPAGIQDADDVDAGDVFSSSDEALSDVSDLSDEPSFEEGGTDEVLPPTSSKNVRAAANKGAVNNTRARPPTAASNKTGARLVIADADASDGFDDFGEVSNLATAVVQQPSISEDSLSAEEPRRGVFADGTNTGNKPKAAAKSNGTGARRPASGPSNLSDLEDFDAGADLADLADSRVEPRPVAVVQAVARARATAKPPPAVPAAPSGQRLAKETGANDRAPGSLNDDEHAAMSGGVWDSGTGQVAAAAPMAPQNTNVGLLGVRSELSTSLSELLGDDDDDDNEATGIRPPQAEPSLASAPQSFSSQPQSSLPSLPPSLPSTPARRGGNLDSAEEPTAFRPPPAPMAQPQVVVTRQPLPAVPIATRGPAPAPASARAPVPAPSPRLAPPPAPPPAPAPRSASGFADDDVWGDSTPRAEPPRAAPPPAPSSANDASVDNSDFDASTDGERPQHVAQARRDPPPDLDESDPDATGLLSDPGIDDEPSAAPPTAPARPQQVPQPPPPPLLSRAMAPRPTPPPPTDDLTSPPSQESLSSINDLGTHDLPESHASSAEILDSAMVIRPAAKPLGKVAGAPRLIEKQADVEEDDFMVDPDATMNLPPLKKSQESRERKPRAKSGQVAAIPSGFSAAVEAANEPPQQKNRRPPTEDMRRKARTLMEQAQRDFAAGKVGAARMNAKLATIYDPDNAEFRRILAAWEEAPRGSPATASSMARPEYVQLYEQAQDLEDEGDVDGALDLLMKGVRLAPNAAAFHNRIGVILAMRKREFDRAAAEIQKAISLEPDNPHYRNNLGKVMQKAGKRKVG